MLRIFKDISVSYFIVSFAGAMSPFYLFESFLAAIIASFVWICCSAIVYSLVAHSRIEKILKPAGETCNIEPALNRFYALHKNKINSISDMMVAVYISNLLLHYGKYSLVLKLLLPYNADNFKNRKGILAYKYRYYYNIAIAYLRLGKKEDARHFYMKAVSIFEDPRFNLKQSLIYKNIHKSAYLRIFEDEQNSQQLEQLLNQLSAKGETLLSRVSATESLVSCLIKNGKQDEAQPHIEFLKNFGGDTIYTKQAEQNDFSPEFLQKINEQPWQPTPVKTRHYKPLVISLVIAALIVTFTVVCHSDSSALLNIPIVDGSNVNSFVSKLYDIIFAPFSK